MWIYWVRLLLIAGSIVATVLLVKKKLNKKSFLKWLVVALNVVLVIVITFFPFEQLFLRSDTPERLFAQLNSGQTIINIADGNDSCMIVSRSTNQNYSETFYLKTDHGYKTANIIPWKIVGEISFDSGSFQIIQVVGTNDYYLLGNCYHEQDVSIFDNLDSEFFIQKNVLAESDTKTLYNFYITAYLQNYSENYLLCINGEDLSVENTN